MHHREAILRRIEEILWHTDAVAEERLMAHLDASRRVFVAGAGRSGLVARFFAMRLVHAGYPSYVVGESVTPAIEPADLLLVITASGETETMVAFARCARRRGARVVTVSTRATSTSADLSDDVLVVGETAPVRWVAAMPLGTAFELSALVLLESAIGHVIASLGIPEETLRERLANLE